jgi:hypothetical protein
LAALVLIALVAAIVIVGAVALDAAGRDARRTDLVVAVDRYRAALDAHDVAILEPLLLIVRVVEGRITDWWSNYEEFGLLHDGARRSAATA